MKYDRLYNFISPVTGKLPIDRGYTLLGDKDGRSFVSPILIDVRQDIVDLKRKIGNFEELKKLDHNRIWIGDYTNEPVGQLHIGIINLPPLAEAMFPNPISPIIGDFRIPNPTFDYLSPFERLMSGPFLPQIYSTKYDTLGNPTGTDISSSLAMTQVRAAQIMKRFDNANFIVGSSTVGFTWENPKMALIPEALKQLYGLGTTYTFTKAQSLGSLETGLLKNTVNNSTGILSKASGGKTPIVNDYVRPIDLIEAIEEQAVLTTTEITEAIAAQAILTTEEIATASTATFASATAASIAHFEIAMIPYSIGITPTGLQIQADINSKLEDAKQYARDQDALQRVDLVGDVIGGGLLSSPILTTFIPNPTFSGKSYMRLPFGSSADRPITATRGMFRYNDELRILEYHDGYEWLSITPNTKPFIITEDFAANLTFGAITNANCGFDGFVSGEKDVNIKIKSSYYIEDEGSSSSLLLLNRYNNGYIFSNKTDTNWNNSFSFNRINNELKTELFKYDNLNDKFTFNKPIEVPYPTNDNDAANKYYVDNAPTGVKNVLGTSGQIFSSGGQYPQISLIESGVSSRSYKLADVTFDVFGRAIYATDGQAVTKISTGYGLTGGIITNEGIIELADTGITAGIYNNTNLQLDSKGRVLAVSESNSIGRISFYGNNIATTLFNEDLVLDPNYAGGNGSIFFNADTTIKNGRSFTLYDGTNLKYLQLKSPVNYYQNNKWILPSNGGQSGDVLKISGKVGNDHYLEWGNSSLNIGYGLLENAGIISVKPSDFLGLFTFNMNKITTFNEARYITEYGDLSLEVNSNLYSIKLQSTGGIKASAELDDIYIAALTKKIILNGNNGIDLIASEINKISVYGKLECDNDINCDGMLYLKKQTSSPNTPPADRVELYLGSDNKLKYKTSDGIERTILTTP